MQIEIVAYGPGLDMLKAESKVGGRLAGALDDSVGLIACENTMNNTKVSRDDMYQRHRVRDGGRNAHHEAPAGRVGLHPAVNRLQVF